MSGAGPLKTAFRVLCDRYFPEREESPLLTKCGGSLHYGMGLRAAALRSRFGRRSGQGRRPELSSSGRRGPASSPRRVRPRRSSEGRWVGVRVRQPRRPSASPSRVSAALGACPSTPSSKKPLAANTSSSRGEGSALGRPTAARAIEGSDRTPSPEGFASPAPSPRASSASGSPRRLVLRHHSAPAAPHA